MTRNTFSLPLLILTLLAMTAAVFAEGVGVAKLLNWVFGR